MRIPKSKRTAHSQDLRDMVWVDRYGYVCPAEQGKLLEIDGVGELDYYNPMLCEMGKEKLLAFRLESRDSDWRYPEAYHPSIAFAAADANNRWHIVDNPPAYDMLEDPSFFKARHDNTAQAILGGIRVTMSGDGFIPNTEFYTGPTLRSLARQPFAVVKGMKDVRLMELPDGRLLLCKRPVGGKYGQGRITLHVIDDLDHLADLDRSTLPTLAVLDSGYPTDWVGANSLYLLPDERGELWVGILSHLGLNDMDADKHYAVTTYRIKLANLLENKIHHIMPRVIATRACFESGPWKTPDLGDVVFPGSLEALGHERYRLWAGLSDARIGTVIVDDPFGLRQLNKLKEYLQPIRTS